ncbi:MAG: PAS domain S-box protein, partial [Opitutae bacterium]|nr:PAS domain S-box protein [Opitutae bacterium]
MLELLGYVREQLVGRRIWELAGFRHIVADQAGLAELQRAGTRHLTDRPLEAADGRRIEVEFVCSTYAMNRHRIMQCNIRDITGRKEAEAALRVGNAALEAAANAVVITDCEGRIEWTNPAFTALTGYILAEARGRNLRELVKSGRQDEEFYRRLWATILAGRVWRGSIINRRKGGSLYTEEMTITPIRNEEGRLTHFIAIKQDVTERKQAEEALRREQDLLTSLIHTIPDRIYFKDRESRFVRINDAQALLFGLRDPDEAIGRTDFDYFSQEHARQARADEQRIMTTGEPVIGREERETWPDGRVTWVSTTKVPLRDAEGRITGLVGISRDVSDRKRLEAQFLQAQKMEAFGQLAGGVAHDFNNILGVMLMQLNLLQMESNLGGKVVSGLAELERHAMRGAGLTRQLLMFSRRQTMEPRILDLNLLLDDIARMLRRVLG